MVAKENSAPPAAHPLALLDGDDLEFVLRFVRASGSLKELAEGYQVSYPTIRARLDRLISRVNDLAAGRRPDRMAALLGDLVEQGELLASAAKKVLRLHRDLVAEVEHAGGK